MDYFIMKQDKRIFYKPKLINTGAFNQSSVLRDQSNPVAAGTIIFVNENRYNEYPGYIDTPMNLVSKNMKHILSKYQKDIIFQPVILIEKESNRQENYYDITVPEIECASEQSICDALGNITDFILDEGKIGNLRIFLSKDYKNQLLVRLDVAESILRRQAYGITFEKVNTEK